MLTILKPINPSFHGILKVARYKIINIFNCNLSVSIKYKQWHFHFFR